ncbi:uncharacterized protein PgNI_01180 [Pyricularia grisea]|uniref:Uncharacterized protein n=1 Tax=Pyricularia grisea TaxID=148305 RepID=A0A6P8BFV7_PYRGI|nr:uncharacterized protein PgNI_01180 [Pyricularia grisea]TLD15600.1 hypothetical protein PgNI_01180 [Pyricularia grisea]
MAALFDKMVLEDMDEDVLVALDDGDDEMLVVLKVEELEDEEVREVAVNEALVEAEVLSELDEEEGVIELEDNDVPEVIAVDVLVGV